MEGIIVWREAGFETVSGNFYINKKEACLNHLEIEGEFQINLKQASIFLYNLFF